MLAAVPRPYATVLAGVAGYLVGSIGVADIVARRHGIDDLRAVGDRNPGYWNTKEQLGPCAAVPVFVGDVAKGALAAGLGAAIADDGEWWLPYVTGGAAMVGHAAPILAGFRGGRSVLTFVGTALVAAPRPAAIAVGVVAATWVATRRFDRAARAGIVAFPVVQIVLEGPERTAATGALMTFIGLRFATAAIADRRPREVTSIT